MSIYTGRQINFGIWIEATRGETATNQYWIPKTNMDFDDKIETKEITSSLGDKLDVSNIELTKQWGEGNIETEASAKALWFFFLTSLWNVQSAAEGSLYKHTFKIKNDGPNPSATIFIEEPNGQFSYPLALISDFTLNAAVGDPVTATASFKSKKAVSRTDLTPTYIADELFNTKNATIKFAENVSDLPTAELTCIESVELNIQKENIEQFCLNYGNEPKDIIDGPISITGSVVATFEADSFYKNYALDGKEFAFEMELLNNDETQSLKITTPKAKFTEYSRDKWNDDIVKVNLNFKVFKNSSLDAITVELVNDLPAYN